ncbi:High mobility group HMG1/HMG2 [Lasiodiplodia theobromae]|uniref:Ataxin-10 homolog n=1 Tax=Lasiodiplodia theobromae TaxID=45133 RepID=A0A5N5D7V3_9PEZI|nr:Essential cytoplasmic protein [Lasiodiplodia theobromae]KAB2573886.1 Copper transport protein 86 [Lasiodiplodia theobromae]KAF4541287.1 Essential cytoplasmic protein [Lasiodiplodia theobromae]KAF9632750.1 High mobility group HMG1/HMG2 [Lasiodiplodia theobromae]
MSASAGASMDSDAPARGSDDPATPETIEQRTPSPSRDSPADPYTTQLRLILQPWIVHFKSPGYIKHDMMAMLQDICKKTLRRTIKEPEVRRAIGANASLWRDLCELLENAVPSLEQRSFAPADPQAPEFEGASGTLIAANYSSLMRDLERLNDLVSIARNVLTTGEVAQDLAAKAQFDQEIFKLISVCVKVTARGFDGDAGTTDEHKWQEVVNMYKKLLITCLQFLNNLVARNERRKLMLWVELFDSSRDTTLPQTEELASLSLATAPKPGGAFGEDLASFNPGTHQPASSPFLLYIGKVGMEVKRELVARGEKSGATEIAAECKKRWQEMPQEARDAITLVQEWHTLYNDLIAKYRHDVNLLRSVKLPPEPKAIDPNATQEENVAALAASINQLQMEVERMKKAMLTPSSKTPTAPSVQPQVSASELLKNYPNTPSRADLQDLKMPLGAEPQDPPPATEADFRMTYNAAYGADILQNGKDDLMKRLETFPERVPPQNAAEVSPSSPVMSPASPNATEPAEDIGDEVSEEEDSEDEDYVVPGDDGRGLLTDVPLILGPSEIEVLPMIIMSGIVPPAEGAPGYGTTAEEIAAIKNMHTVRCHLLLAQDNGRNLLRELLIFVAAWDLREEELYFKFMVKIMEAILTNGLMPFSYHAFRESKDIISPAQAVIMKLLTNIFKARQTQAQSIIGKDGVASYPLRVDVHMVNFLFTEFRRHIIPQTCALIFLQGKIRAGHAHPEDFPLNLWDMERMYEGVYQYLEFFAILTEHDVWKKMMADWEITSELVTLLKELDAAIPKGTLLARKPPAIPDLRTSQPQQVPPPETGGTAPAPVAVERPYDINAPSISSTAAAIPSEPYAPASNSQYVDEPGEEPSDFEWRNLKKLTVLVLTSLVWKSRKVQDQVRTHKGIEAILSCCQYDEHNPYIKEHAIMCLRFLLEGNKENQDLIRELEPKGAVPNEVLDQHGYETFWDQRGQVGLRRKDGGGGGGAAASAKAAAAAVQAAADAAGIGSSSQDGEKRKPPQIGSGRLGEPPNLDLLMQQVMRDLPAQVTGARQDAEKAAALAKLDKTLKDGK